MSMKREMPGDYAILRPTMKEREVFARWGCGNKAMRRWDAEIGYSSGYNRRAPVFWTPERDELLRSMLADDKNYAEVAEAIGCSKNRVTGRAHRLGLRMSAAAVHAQQVKAASVGRAAISARPKRYTPRNRLQVKGRHFEVLAPNERPALAARHLQRFYVGVYHRGRENKAEQGIWQVGARRMTEAEMIALAQAKGFERDCGWRLAA